MLRFISDLHLGHTNIIKHLDGRAFETIEEMDDYVISQWNSVVKKGDEVVILGDFSFYDGKKTNEILRKLHGTKHLIKGNHDNIYLKDPAFDKSLFKSIREYGEFSENGRCVVCSHYPILFYNGQYRVDQNGEPKRYMFYGHIHNTQDQTLLTQLIVAAKAFTYTDKRSGEEKHIPFNLVNCFCMFSDYKPLTINEWLKQQGT